jgi:lipopolysaccharide/colanic/teichoic acid biosynthesis glycosyltransferase
VGRRFAWGHAGVVVDALLKRALDLVGAAVLLVLLVPLFCLVAIAISLDSRGSIFFRCCRVGYRGRDLSMLKFRKMTRDAVGPGLTVADDPRLTRVGRVLVRMRIDELPQLWHVLKGEMSLVGPRPEDPRFVRLWAGAYEVILRVKPGITGLSQLAFANEASILQAEDPTMDYVRRVMPQKLALDRLYVLNHTIRMDLRILYWTGAVILSRGCVAVDRRTGKPGMRRRPKPPAGSGTPANIQVDR